MTTYLKQHRKANLQLDGRKLIGNFEVSLSNAGDREVLMEFMSEMRKQLRAFDSEQAKKKKVAKKRPTKKKKVAAKKKVVRRR